MLSPPKAKQIETLLEAGRSLREISRLTGTSRNAIRRLIKSGYRESSPTTSRCHPHETLIAELFQRCKGNAVRIHEILSREYGVDIAYSTLTRHLRAAHPSKAPRAHGEFTFQPGEEMQFDTSPHRVIVSGKTRTLQCAALVLCYSRYLFAAYYPRFTRFEAKCFLEGALTYFDGGARTCMIDNTSVALSAGSGADAQIAPEMAGFERAYGFRFKAHPVNRPQRKGRVERPFHFLETNFLAGRTFTSLADLNAQARQWCDTYANARVKRVLGMTPREAYVMEKPHLQPLPEFPPPVYKNLMRVVDTSGYVHVETNRYSVPERLVGKRVAVHRWPQRLDVYFQGKRVAAHAISEATNQRIRQPEHRQTRKPSSGTGPSPQECALRNRDAQLDGYLDKLKQRVAGRGIKAFQKLQTLWRTYPEEAFLAAVARANTYGLFDLGRLEKLILEEVAGDYFQLDPLEDER